MTSSSTRHAFLAFFLSSSLLLTTVLGGSARDESALRDLLASKGGDSVDPDNVIFLQRLLSARVVNPRTLADVVRRWWMEQAEEEEEPFMAALSKRAMWTPLGHLPASARIGRLESGSRKPAEGHGSPNSVFRYG